MGESEGGDILLLADNRARSRMADTCRPFRLCTVCDRSVCGSIDRLFVLHSHGPCYQPQIISYHGYTHTGGLHSTLMLILLCGPA